MSWRIKRERFIKKGDVVLFLVCLAVSLCLLWLRRKGEPGGTVAVTVDGKTTRYALSEDRTIPISVGSDGYNEVIIRDGSVRMEEANCPDQVCVRHQAIFRTGEWIICLPHAVYVEIEQGEERETDN